MYLLQTAPRLEPYSACHAAVLLSKAGLALFASPDYFHGNQIGLSGVSLALQVQHYQ